MQPFRLLVIAVTAVAGSVLITPAAEAQIPRAPLALEPIGATGEAIWPAFESWTRNEDGTVTMVMGYMNRNEEIVEIPIGEDNRMGPGDPDNGQPTHFLPGRHERAAKYEHGNISNQCKSNREPCKLPIITCHLCTGVVGRTCQGCAC